MERIYEEIRVYLEYCEKTRRMSNTTLAMKKNVLNRFREVTRIESVVEIDNLVFDKWMARETERGVSAQAMNTYNAIVISMIRYYQDIGNRVPLNLNLIKKLRWVPNTRKSYTEMEIKMVILGANQETRLMIMIMAETGMRIAELVRLNTAEISGRKIEFVGKGKKYREVYMSAQTADELGVFLDGREGYVWGGMALNGEPPSINTVRKRMSEAFLAAGFEGFYPHALRHSFATNLQRKGATVSEIKEMMGHSSIATTERYLHEFDGRMEELFSKYQ